MNTQAPLAANQQATRSLEIQSVDLPQDLPVSAVTSAGSILLCRLEGGSLMQDFTEKVREAAAAAYNLSKKGKVTLELEFRPAGARRMDIVAKVTSKVPQPERHPTTHFVTADGQLPVHDPDQQRMDLRVVRTVDVDSQIIDVPLDDQPAPRRVA